MSELRSRTSANITYDGVAATGQFFGIGVELWDGFSDEVSDIRCLNSQYGICVGATARNFNQSNIQIRNTLGAYMTAVALNYANEFKLPNPS